MKELKPSGLFTVAIPLESHNIQDTKADGIMWQMPDVSWDSFYFEDEIKAPYEIIGSVTAEHIDFDPSDYIETTLGKTWAKDYTTGKFIDNASQAFRSLLTANDVHFVNPYGDYATAHKRHILTGTWQQAESKLVEKILILKPL